MLSPFLVLATFDPTFSLICALFAPPFLLSLLLLLHSFHLHSFHLHSLKLHLYRSTLRLHLPSPTPLTPTLVLPFTPPLDIDHPATHSPPPSLKDPSTLLPPHRQRELQEQRLREQPPPPPRTLLPPASPSSEESGGADSEANAEQRLRLSPFLSLALLLALLTPALLLVAWTTVLVVCGYLLTGLCLFFLITTLVPLYLACAAWQRGGWRLTPQLSHLLSFSLLSYITLTLLLTYLLPPSSSSSSSSSTSFFALSLPFLALHLALNTEVSAVHQRSREAQLLPYLRGEGRNRREEAEGERRAERTKAQLRAHKAHTVLGTRAEEEEPVSPLSPPTPPHPRMRDEEEEEEEGEGEEGEGGVKGKAKLVELPSHTHSFTAHIQSRIHRARLRHLSSSSTRLTALHIAEAGTLLAYSLTVYFHYSPPGVASGGGGMFDSRWMGVLVSLTMLLLDLTRSLLHPALPHSTSLALALLTRITLCAFDDTTWYIAYCLLFSLHALLLTRAIISSYLPWWGIRITGKPRGIGVESKQMTLPLLLSSPPPVAAAFPAYARPLASTLDSSAHPSSLPLLLLFSLLSLFLMATLVAYTTHPPSFGSFPQYQVGLLTLLLTLVLSLSLLLFRLLFFHSFQPTLPTVACALLTQAVFVGCGLLLYSRTSSLLALLLLSLLPPFLLSLLSTWTLSICAVTERWSRRSLLSLFACLTLLTTLGLTLSELSSPSFLGYTLVLTLLIAITGAMPLVKYYATLRLDGLDELAILASLTLLSSLLGLLCFTLSLPLLPSLLLVAGGASFPVLLLLLGGAIDYHYRRSPSTLCLFSITLLYTHLLALSALTLAVVDLSLGLIATAASLLFILTSALFLYWTHRNHRLPLPLRVLLALLVLTILIAGVMLSTYLALWYDAGSQGVGLAFFAGSGTWLFLLACLLLYALLCQYAATCGPCLLHFSPSVFPVYVYHKRTGALRLLHAPLMLLLLSVALFLLWCLAALLLSYTSVALSCSTLALLLTYLLLRHLTLTSSSTLLPLLPHLDEPTLTRAHSDVWRAHSVGHEGDPTLLPLITALEGGRDVMGEARRRRREARKAFGLPSSPHLLPALYHLLLSSPRVDPLDLDFCIARLLRAERAVASLSALLQAMRAHTFFLLRLSAESRRCEEVGEYGMFRVWLEKGEGVRLDERLQVEEVWAWGVARRREMTLWVQDWRAMKVKERETMQQSRAIEDKATRRRTEIHAMTQQMLRGAAEEDGGGAGKAGTMVDPYAGLKAGVARGSAAPVARAKPGMEAHRQRLQRLHAITQGKVKPPLRPWQADKQRAKAKKMNHAPHKTVLRVHELVEEEKKEPEGEEHSVKEEEEEEHKEAEEEKKEEEEKDDEKAHEEPTTAASPAPSQAPSSSTLSSESIVVPLVVYDHEEAHALFTRIQAAYDATSAKWVDATFPPAPSSIYIDGVRDPSRPSAVHQAAVEGWKRPEEIVAGMKENGVEGVEGEVAVSCDGFSCNDVIQGNIGTCYLLSAMGVMAAHASSTSSSPSPSTPLLSSVLPVLTSGVAHACGCYLVLMYHAHCPFYLFIDDLLPVLANSSPAFSHCRRPTELWVALIEKAYAKAATSYEAIQGGYIHQALIDLSSSHGEEVRLKDGDGRLTVREEELFARLQEEWGRGAMIGAGSNTGTNDHEVNGIVQGHAYAVIGLYGEEGGKGGEGEGGEGGLRLIRLRNPWGSGEWQGEWGDGSERWTRFYKERLGWVEEDDGTFWMAFSDFLQAYEAVYVARAVPRRVTVGGEWRVDKGTAAGPREPRGNPQWRMTVGEGERVVYVEMEQAEVDVKEWERRVREAEGGKVPGLGANGYAYVQFYVVEGGERVERIVKGEVKGWANEGKMVNARLISAQVEVEPGRTYSFLCCTNVEGVERSFSLSVFSQQPIQLEAIP